jgi:hypothetical protein
VSAACAVVGAGRFAAMVAAFCARLGWTDLEALVTKFQQRVFFGVRPEVRQPCWNLHAVLL